jgi:hypothetical protein
MFNPLNSYCSTVILTIIICLFSCKPETIEKIEVDLSQYPDDIQKIFEAHGGLDNWAIQKSMSYEIEKDGQNEKQIIDLKDRRERIEAADFKMGFDGKDFWLEADTTYKGNPLFYKNLMFYFYAMPFVLADKGINYSTAEVLTYEGVNYPGIKISYNSEVGISPQDEYYLHYNPDTYQMEWLGYTVTYFSKEKSTSVKWIRYNDWKKYDSLLLPKSLAWYTLTDNLPIDERNRVEFVNVVLSPNSPPDQTFSKTEGAKIVEQ